jgi:hypothetical protein
LIQGAHPAAEFADKIEREARARVEEVALGSPEITRAFGTSKDLDLKKVRAGRCEQAPWRKAEMFAGGVGISIE